MSFPGYSRYKESGVEWLGQVPAHWEIVPLKHVASLKGRLGWQGLRAEEYTDEGPYLVTSEHLERGRVQWERCYHVTDDRYEMAPEIKLRERDVLMMKDGAAMGKLAFIDSLPGPACLNSHLLLFRPNDGRFENFFLYHVLGTPGFSAYMVQERTGTTFFGISQESIGNFPFALPPLAEQQSILDFLSHELSEMDSLIEEQRRLIKLLKEKRQAVISHAVTKGLNPGAPMKPSGIEWLGDLPRHWSICPLKHLIQVGTSISYGIVQPGDPQEDGVPFVQTTNISAGNFDLDSLQRTTAEIASSYPRSRLEGGEVILGIRASIGAAYVVPLHLRGANLSRGVARIACGGAVLPEFLVCALRSDSTSHYWQVKKQGSTFNEVSIETVRELPVPLPPVNEQHQLCAYLSNQIAEYDTLISSTNSAIDLLQERRSALISAAVTGKIEVRQAVLEPMA